MLTRYCCLLIFVAAILCLGCSPGGEQAVSEGPAGPSEPDPGAGPATELAASSWTDNDAPWSCGKTSGGSLVLPADFYDSPAPNQWDADDFAWQTFLWATAGENWKSLVSTVDLIECNQYDADGNKQDPPATYGTCTNGRFVPAACEDMASADTRILDQVGKIDDTFLEAKTRGLSGDPVIAVNGTYVRYQIVVSPGMSNWIQQPTAGAPKQDGLQLAANITNMTQDVAFPWPASDGDDQSIEIKIAWMDMNDLPEGLSPSNYYQEDVLVYTPDYRNSTGVASCEPTTMGVVGIHLTRKTDSQRAWVWGTFEHKDNAPTCAPPIEQGNKASATANTNAPTTGLDRNYNFYPQGCSDCPGWNIAPTNNAKKCTNPYSAEGGSSTWCLDEPPSQPSQICRQVAATDYGYGTDDWSATEPNANCSGKASGAWTNYQLITTQWTTGIDNTKDNVASQIKPGGQNILPQTSVLGADGLTRSYLANTSMESYERSNCLGCHSKSINTEDPNTTPNFSTDFVYFLGVEVPNAQQGWTGD